MWKGSVKKFFGKMTFKRANLGPTLDRDFASEERQAKLEAANWIAQAARERMQREGRLRSIESKQAWPGGATAFGRRRGIKDGETS